MSIISALAEAYKHIPNAPQLGFSQQKISAVFVLQSDGSVREVRDMRQLGGKKPAPIPMSVPIPPKRTSGLSCSFLWDKTPYAVGLTATPNEKTAQQHEYFVDYHKKLLAGSDDAGLQAFLAFLDRWNPEERQHTMPLGWSDELLDSNIVFILDQAEDLNHKIYLHDRPAAEALWARAQAAGTEGALRFCPIVGDQAAIAPLHPSIKGVMGGQSSGTSLISYNKDAFTSYGHEQGDNAQISQAVAERYTGALNLFLERGSGHNMRLADTTLTFWAEASEEEVRKRAEASYLLLFSDALSAQETKDIKETAEKERTEEIDRLLGYVRKGKEMAHLDSEVEDLLGKDIGFYILGLAPNAARLVVRFFLRRSFRHIVENYRQFIEEMRIEPPAGLPYPQFCQYLLETALLRKRENVNPHLATEWFQAVLTGQPYPQALLSAILTRIAREGGKVNALRAAILKAVLMRNYGRGKKADGSQIEQDKDNRKGELKAMLDMQCHEKGYLFGRLFAVYEQMQSAALGRNVNATIKDKFYSSAMVQPQKIFSVLERNSAAHQAKLRKERTGQAVNLDKLKSDILSIATPKDGVWPKTFTPEQQALFSLGYYHQRQEFFKKKSDSQIETEEQE
ncbi:type I-C CRISPR-associated protein Cas8c/Csd1 [Candidatus Tokpelaia sp.]|uniref:type I-C CRISPR-associated protein Cas8c/Csd1 n=1 Tax=Candidatus Tokpelaia sp. TaxID=2233777 RepID=UPI00123863B9|nr:type I-C CRISPR-associated protein Cas8c/Csd1 [Candidatus Tokpelaia sp.]KAA6404666.1 type I-C CRISPR-associated protein Cas8c/Csd1 [Candidatus Tokpelaia sp.]